RREPRPTSFSGRCREPKRRATSRTAAPCGSSSTGARSTSRLRSCRAREGFSGADEKRRMVKILDLMPARVAPVVLAAGESVRMGHPKALLPLRGGTFLSAILDTLEALDLDAPFVVLGGHTAEIAPSLSRRQVRIVLNPDFKQGQLSSIQRALGALGPEASCALLWPVDQPGVS